MTYTFINYLYRASLKVESQLWNVHMQSIGQPVLMLQLMQKQRVFLVKHLYKICHLRES